jgi:hypothetical protein
MTVVVVADAGADVVAPAALAVDVVAVTKCCYKTLTNILDNKY